MPAKKFNLVNNEKGVVHAAVIIILLLGLAVGVWLAGQRAGFFSQASTNSISGPIPVPTPDYAPITSINFTDIYDNPIEYFKDGMQVKVSFKAYSSDSNIKAIHTGGRSGVNSQEEALNPTNEWENSYQGFPGNFGERILTVPFYMEFLAEDTLGRLGKTQKYLALSGYTADPNPAPLPCSENPVPGCVNNNPTPTPYPYPIPVPCTQIPECKPNEICSLPNLAPGGYYCPPPPKTCINKPICNPAYGICPIPTVPPEGWCPEPVPDIDERVSMLEERLEIAEQRQDQTESQINRIIKWLRSFFRVFDTPYEQ